ncbi:amidophosphoribosyltransferase [soil metagenome]
MLIESALVPLEQSENEKPEHECGIGMIYTFDPSAKKNNLIAIGHALQHRGQNGAGIKTDAMAERKVGSGLLNKALSEDDQSSLEIPSHWAMIHLRYGTSGGYGDMNLQPISMEAVNGEICDVEVNGNMPLMQHLRKKYDLPEDVSDTYIATHILSQLALDDWDSAILEFAELEAIRESANNMFIGVGDAMYVLRDRYGLHPLVVGQDENGRGLMYSSETVAFQKVGMKPSGEVPRGSITKLTPTGVTVLKEGNQSSGNACIFEPAYFSSPNSSFPREGDENPDEWMSNMHFRMRCGERVATECPVPNADFMVGMPDSGVPFASGFANAAGIPYYPAIIRSHYNGDGDTRTFMQDAQMATIPTLVKGKLMPVVDPRMWKDKVVVIGDDSMVRGSNSKAITDMIWQLGVKEIHWRLGFPQVKFPCPLGVSFRSRDELIAAITDGDVDKIAALIGATSVGFISNEGIIAATQDNVKDLRSADTNQIFLDNGWCGGCVTGHYPIKIYDMKEGTIFSSTRDNIYPT